MTPRDKTHSLEWDTVFNEDEATQQLWFIMCFSPLCVIQYSLIMSSMICFSPATLTSTPDLCRNLIPLSASQGRSADEIQAFYSAWQKHVEGSWRSAEAVGLTPTSLNNNSLWFCSGQESSSPSFLYVISLLCFVIIMHRQTVVAYTCSTKRHCRLHLSPSVCLSVSSNL